MRRLTVDRDAKIEQLAAPRSRSLLRGPLRARHQRLDASAVHRSQSPAGARATSTARERAGRASARVEELLQNGVAAFQRGEADEARRLLQAAIDGGAPSEDALAVLERLNRLETAVSPVPR